MNRTDHDLTGAILAAPDGSVVYGRRGISSGSVWVVVGGWRYGADGADASPKLICVHHSDARVVGTTHDVATVRVLGLRSSEWRIGGAVPGTPAAYA